MLCTECYESRRFDGALSEAFATEMSEVADANANDEWKAKADAAIEAIARSMPKFTTDDVWEFGNLPETRENRALGGRIRAAVNRGIIRGPVGQVKTRQVRSHASPKNVWESLIHGQ